MILDGLGMLGVTAVVLLPGCWLTFGLPAAGFGFWDRVACGILLGPAVIGVQFYFFRWTGLSFGAACAVLPLVNLPALWLVARRSGRPVLPPIKTVLGWMTALVLPVLFLSIWIRDPAVRASWGHAWYHADIVYALAGGALRPEEPQLAGVRLAYPWLQEIVHGVIAYLLDTAPNSSYVWVNLAWLAATLGLMASIVGRLGGDLWARLSSVILLCFGVNAVGFIGYHVVPEGLIESYPILGDGRYTPWVRKFGVFAGSALGVGLITALTLLVVNSWDSDRKRSPLPLVLLLLIALAVSYPMLFPVGVLLVGSRVLVAAARGFRLGRTAWIPELVAWAAVIAAAGLIGLGYLHLVTADRVAPALGVSSLWEMKVKAATCVVVLAPLLAGLAVAGPSIVRNHPDTTSILLLTTAGCLLANVVVAIQFPSNEYKYIFPAAVCLTPFAAIAWSKVAVWLGRTALPVSAALALLLAGPAVELVLTSRHDMGPRVPQVSVGQFSMRLESGQRFAALADAIRTRTPENSVLIAGNVGLDLVALTRRPVYVPYERFIYGLGMASDDLLKRTFGYDGSLLDRRLATLHAIYDPHQGEEPAAAIGRIRDELGRPLVIVLDPSRDSRLGTWLAEQPKADLLYQDEDEAAWLLGV